MLDSPATIEPVSTISTGESEITVDYLFTEQRNRIRPEKSKAIFQLSNSERQITSKFPQLLPFFITDSGWSSIALGIVDTMTSMWKYQMQTPGFPWLSLCFEFLLLGPVH
jgi:hypothetical protein